MKFLNNRLSYRLLLYVIVCSTFFAAIITGIQLFIEYKKDVGEIDDDLAMIRRSYVPSVLSSRYNMDTEHLRLLLEGIHKLRDVAYVKVTKTQNGKETILASTGDADGSHDIIQTYPLVYKRNERDIDLGTLHVGVSLASVRARLWDRLIMIVASNALKTFLMSFCILWIMQILAIRHLRKIAAFAATLNIDSLDRKITLRRNKPSDERPDDLDDIVDAINKMIDRIKRDVEARNAAMQTQQALNHELQRTRERFALAMEASKDGLWDWHVETDEVYYSPGYAAMLGFESGELTPHVDIWKGLIHPDDKEMVVRANMDCLENRRKDFEIEYRMQTKKGQWLWILGRGMAAERDQDGRARRMIGTHTDITKRKKTEERLQEVQKMESIGSLAGGIAHDFNNILFPIIGMSELLLDELPHDDRFREYAREIHNAGKRAGDLVKQILTFSRQTEHKMLPVRIQPVIKEALKLSRATIPANIEIEQAIADDCGPVMADPVQLHQILMNLITNALHAVETNGGKIVVRLWCKVLGRNSFSRMQVSPGPYAVLSVEDTGFGIPPGVMDKIFEPYFTTKEQGKGTGLGLAVVYGIVKASYGEIVVDSEEGKGTTITIYFPITSKPVDMAETVSADGYKTGNERILLVDDEPAIIKYEKTMLKSLGYHVVGCHDGMTALDVFKAAPDDYDLVITDMTMPGMTGLQLARELLAIRPLLPVIICTGFSEQLDRETVVAAGIKELLLKPVGKFKIAETIRSILDAHGP
ncbi:MAG: ATP-binding protein [Thermodesulfobacteriota bacterium]|nr:ATP-binding protein [Thermodesulfobacteriota bacterium]